MRVTLSYITKTGLIACLIATSLVAHAEIIKPTIKSSSLVGQNSRITDQNGLRDSGGTVATVDTGDTLAEAQAIYHVYNTGGHTINISAVEQPAAPYPYYIFDLGEDKYVNNAVIWEYAYSGPARWDDTLKTFGLQYNTELQGFATFTGPTNLYVMPDEANANKVTLPGSLDATPPQTIALGGDVARYVKMHLIDNHNPTPDYSDDKVNFAELRFDGESPDGDYSTIVPEIIDHNITSRYAPVENLTNNVGLYDSTAGTLTAATIDNSLTLEQVGTVYGDYEIYTLSVYPNLNEYVVFDLGQDRELYTIQSWPYSFYNGGANNLKEFTLQFNTAAEGGSTFSGSTYTYTLGTAGGQATIDGKRLIGPYRTYVYADISEPVRYVRMVFTAAGNNPSECGLMKVCFSAVPAVPLPKGTVIMIL